LPSDCSLLCDYIATASLFENVLKTQVNETKKSLQCHSKKTGGVFERTAQLLNTSVRNEATL
jgi:hypothetical protein